MNFNLNSGWGKVATNGLPFLGTGRHFFVGDSSTPNLDMIQQLFGYRSDALGTLRFFDDVDEAIGACTAGAGDTIFVLPNHAETITAAGGWAIDVAGVSIVGIGQGENRPIITFGTNATASITNSAANCRIANLVFKCNVASQNHMLDLTADDFIIEDCDFREGTQTGLSFITADGSDADCDRLTIRRCKFHAPTAGNYDNAISLAKDFTGVRIDTCEFYGDFDDACISIPAGGNAQVDCQIKDVIATNLQSGQHAIEINSNTSTGKIINVYVQTDALATSVDAGGLEMFNVYFHDGTDQAGWTPLASQPDSAENVLGANDADNGFDSSSVADNRDGSVLERLETIIATLRDDVASNFIGVDDADNVAATSNVVANRDGSVLERLEHVLDCLVDDETTNALGVNDADNAFSSSSVVANVDGSILERLEALMDPTAGYNPRLGFGVTKVSNLADGAGTDDLFTVTGRVLITSLTGEVTTVVGGAATLKIRDITNSVDLCAATTIDNDAVGTMYALTSISANILNGTGAVPVIGSIPNITGAQQLDVAIVGDAQAALTLSQVLDAADTGNITWRLTYIPLISGATVAAAA